MQNDTTRYHAYTEAIKNLKLKDYKALASLAIPDIDSAENIVLSSPEMSMANMKKADYIAKIKLHGENFILHMEFEAEYRSNSEIQKRMLKYYTYLYCNEGFPVYQVLVLLKEPSIKNIANSIQPSVLEKNPITYQYDVIRLYEMDKYDILKQQLKALYPLRVFMRRKGESSIEHLKECLNTAEQAKDPDYYFLTVECSKKLFGSEMIEKIFKETIYMSSALYKNPYEKGLVDGEIKGEIKGKAEGILRILTKKFGLLPNDIVNKIKTAEVYQLDLAFSCILDANSLEDVSRFFIPCNVNVY